MSSSVIIPLVRPTSRPTVRPSGRRPARPAVQLASDATTPLRLTGRGRLVVRLAGVTAMGALLVLSVLLGVLLGGGSAQGGEQSRPLPVVRHVVAPGETLWQVAERVAPGEDPRDVVLRIVETNGLTGANVEAGTRLVVPLGR
jgi:LysM domain